MQRRILLLAGFFLALAPDSPSAQGLEFSGDVSLGVSTLEDRHGIARVDGILSFGLFRYQDRAIRAEIGTYAFLIRGDRPHETYAALSYDDRLRIGFLRPAYDLVLPSVFALTAPAVAEARVEYTRALATSEAVRFNSVPFGASYTVDSGDTLWALSLQDADDGDFRSAAVALQHHLGVWTLSGAVEGVWDQRNTYQGLNAKLGARYSGADWEIGLALLHPDANARPDTLAFDASYTLSPYVTLIGFGEITETGGDDAYGLAARHRIDKRTEMVISATDGDAHGEMHLTFSRRY